MSPRDEDSQLHPVFVPIRYAPKIGGILNDKLARKDMERPFLHLIDRFQPDVVLSSWLFPDGCAAAQLCQNDGLPLVLITQGTDTHGYLNSAIRRRNIMEAVSLSHATICRSGDLAKRLENAGADSAKLHVIYNGVDTENFRVRSRSDAQAQLGLNPEAPHFLFVGNLLPVKNPFFLIQAIQELNRRRSADDLIPAHLHLIGDGPLRGSIETEIAAQNASEWIHLHGRKTPTEIACWMSASTRLCLSSHNEGFPNVILEAMSCGLPVISTDVGGIREKIDRPERGQLVKPGDLEGYVRALADSISSIPSDSALTDEDLGWNYAADEYLRVMSR
ncbi:MAG: glycosyltransferase [Verrucomicrobiae bacterium]|nr:glycosyltransferase [Verrucomicrobiae bacterium]